MTVQISVVIWTIINFILLYLVLNFLLFKPMLKVMDERRTKIEQGKALCAQKEKRAAADAEKAERLLASRETELKAKVDTALAEVAAECKRERLLAEDAQKRKAEADMQALKAEEDGIKAKLSEELPELSDAVVKKLLEKGR